MKIDVETKDCTAISDSELSEMADMCADGPLGYDVGILSKQGEAWVLITEVRDAGVLCGFSFCTLERIGGTPTVLVGLASVKRCPRSEEVLEAMVGDQLRRALLAFPDEDVLVGARLVDPAAFAAFRGLTDVVPRPGHRASGEERAWGRRLAKRFGAEGRVDDRTLVVRGTGDTPAVLDHESPRSEVDPELAAMFASLDRSRGDSIITFGWAMAEDLAGRT